MSTNLSMADASDKQSNKDAANDPRKMTSQELLNRICKIWSNMSLVQEGLGVKKTAT